MAGFIQPQAALGVDYGTQSGLCPQRDLAYTRTLALNRKEIPFSQLNNRLNESFCIGFSVNTTEDNGEPLLTFQNSRGSRIGMVTLTSSRIRIDLAGLSSNFPTNSTGARRLQICSNGSSLQLYEDCVPVLAPLTGYGDVGFSNSNSIIVLENDPPVMVSRLNKHSEFA